MNHKNRRSLSNGRVIQLWQKGMKQKAIAIKVGLCCGWIHNIIKRHKMETNQQIKELVEWLFDTGNQPYQSDMTGSLEWYEVTEDYVNKVNELLQLLKEIKL